MKQNEMEIGKVKLNLEYYEGQDLYSDGDIEDEILEIVKNRKDYDRAISDSNRFEVFYHLSKEREMIARVMDITKHDNVLEIGAGCGAISKIPSSRREVGFLSGKMPGYAVSNHAQGRGQRPDPQKPRPR